MRVLFVHIELRVVGGDEDALRGVRLIVDPVRPNHQGVRGRTWALDLNRFPDDTDDLFHTLHRHWAQEADCKYKKLKPFYSPQTKLWEGNVFKGICLSTGRRGGGIVCDIITCFMGYPTHPFWSGGISYPLLVISNDHHWRPVQTCSLDTIPPASTTTDI